MATLSLSGKVVLITGASRGIGRAVAQTFAAASADIAFTYLASEEKALALVQELSTTGRKAKAYRSDAASFEAAEALVSTVVKDFGHIDILVNNAGITRDGLILRMSEKAWDEVQAANLKSCFSTTRHVSRHFLRQRSGNIINISSIVGIKGNPGQANYVAAKAGIIGFTKAVAQELGTVGVRCNAIAPGFIETDMTDKMDEKTLAQWKSMIPLKRIGGAEEVAQVCLFLASDMSSYITGQTLQVDGGMG